MSIRSYPERRQFRQLPTFPMQEAGFYGREQKQRIWAYPGNFQEIQPIEGVLRQLARAEIENPLQQVLQNGSKKDQTILRKLAGPLTLTSIEESVLAREQSKIKIYRYIDKQTGLVVTEVVYSLGKEEILGVDDIASLAQHNLIVTIMTNLDDANIIKINFYDEYFSGKPARDDRPGYRPQVAIRKKLGETKLQ